MLTISETFGPTFQGEGPAAGTPAHFIRLGRCNLACRWCDTPYTWDWKGANGVAFSPAEELTERSVYELVAEVTADLVIITGGEPLLQRSGLIELAGALVADRRRVHVETNGTMAPEEPLTDLVESWNVSPKLSNSGMPKERRIRPAALAALLDTDRAMFKFVATGLDDLSEIADIVTEVGIPDDRVWIMPEGTTPSSITDGLAALADGVIAHDWNLTPRLHVLAWGNRRGV